MTAGWIEKNATLLERLLTAAELTFRTQRAATGTLYYYINAENASIVVRIADHADAYGTATFTIDPAIDQLNSVIDWLTEHADNKPAFAKALAAHNRAKKAAETRKEQKERQQYEFLKRRSELLREELANDPDIKWLPNLTYKDVLEPYPADLVGQPNRKARRRAAQERIHQTILQLNEMLRGK